MSKHRIRNVPAGGKVVSIVHRCLQARFLLTPSGRLNKLVLGVLAKAQRLYGVELYLPVVMSNHLHLLLWVNDARQMARFMGFVSGNIAREVGRLHGWKGKFWDGQYSYALVAEDEASLYERLHYFLSHGCKENLVSSPRHWPGIHPAKMLLSASHRRGIWVDRTALYRARLKSHAQMRGKQQPVRAADFEEELEVELSPLPCWEHLSPIAYRARIREVIAAIEAETAERHRLESTCALGRKAILCQDPQHRPESAKKSRAPIIHTVSRTVRKEYEAAYRMVVEAYRRASAKLRDGDHNAVFPEGTFPPGLPFVPYTAQARAG